MGGCVGREMGRFGELGRTPLSSTHQSPHAHTQTQALEEEAERLAGLGPGAVALARQLLGGHFAAAVLEVGL